MPRSHSKYYRLFLVFIALITVVIGVLYGFRYAGINRTAVIEAGTAVPNAAVFIKDPSKGASYITDITTLDTRLVGVHKLKIQSGAETYTVKLKVADTIPPKASTKEISIGVKDTLNPEDLVADIQDETSLTASFKNKPRFGKLGDYDVTVVLKDAGGNRIEVTSRLHISKVKHLVSMEAGDDRPSVEDFLTDPADTGSFITDMKTIPANVPGLYEIRLALKGNVSDVLETKLEIKDTIAPSAVVKPLDLYECRFVTPEEFIVSIGDATNVKASFQTEPNVTKTNTQDVVLLLEDASGNKTQYKTTFRSSKVLETVRVEASKEVLDYKTILKKEYDIDDAQIPENPFIPDKIGDFPVQITIDNRVYESNVHVVDSLAPTGNVVNRKIWLNDKIEASQFVDGISDGTQVNVSFVEEPDFSKPGDQNVGIKLIDEAGNQTLLTATLSIEEDKEPPVIYGVKDTTVYLNNPVSYKKNVYVIDNKDGELSVTVDSSKVNLRKEGQYKVVFSATDASGNTASKEAMYTVKAFTVSMDELNKLADEILAKITTEDMTLLDKAWEIYKYVNKHITYTGVSDKTDWMKEAYSGITKGVGDCFTYFSVSELLLNRIGMETMRVERLTKPGEAKHYWHMVNYSEGWYHFDACIHKPPLVSFMLTDAEIDAFSKKVGKNNYYYRYDRENYPATPVREISVLEEGGYLRNN